jgi:penicillin-binding protein 2
MTTAKPDTITPWRFYFIGSVMLVPFLVLVLRLVSLQLLDERSYRTQANTQSRRLVIVPAPRGNIYDRNGNLLVGNRPSYNIVADVAALQGEIGGEYRRLIANERVVRGGSPVESGVSARERRQRRLARERELASLARINVLQRHLDQVNRVTGRHDRVDAVAARQHLERSARTRAIPITLVRDISEGELARFAERVSVENPLRIVSESVRIYPYGMAAAHVLGYVGNDRSGDADFPEATEADPDVAEFLALPEKTRQSHMLKKFDGQKAISGVEVRFDKEVLQGTPGYQLWTVRPNGYTLDKIAEAAPRQGAHLYLSLDIELQLVTERELARRFPGKRASVVALDVNTGEVLVCANAPSFDPARMNQRGYLAEFQQQNGIVPGDWSNRATQVAYPPGSSFKPITAIAALRSGVVTPDEQIECASYIELGRRRFVEHDRMMFGAVNLSRMLQVSSNVYCYHVGQRMGIDALAAEAQRFGLDAPSTLEIGRALIRNLIIPTPGYKRRIGDGGWALGDTFNTAIGQGYVQTTVLHLACMFASIARNETRTDATIIHDPARASGYTHGGEPIGLTPEQYKALIDGLVACGRNGTGRAVAGFTTDSYPIDVPVATKTGTAQTLRNTKNLAWTLAFAPVEKPQIAIAVMIEGERGNTSFYGGSNAGPIANVILSKWRSRILEHSR